MIPRAYLNLRGDVPERRAAFRAGLRRMGYEVEELLPAGPRSERDVLVTWNRIGIAHHVAQRFEGAGARVLVAENAAWGNDFLGRRWLSLAQGRHNTAGRVQYGGPERWDALGAPLEPLRLPQDYPEVVLLPQRGIGPPGTAMPANWVQAARKQYPDARVRVHPGLLPVTELARDLRRTGLVVTWGSGAAIKAAMLGIAVASGMPDWIGWHIYGERDEMLERLAWAQWEVSEIASGDAFVWVLKK